MLLDPLRHLSRLFSPLHPIALVWWNWLHHHLSSPRSLSELPGYLSASSLDSSPSVVYTAVRSILLKRFWITLLLKTGHHLDGLPPHCPREKSPSFLALSTASLLALFLATLLLMLDHLVLTQTRHALWGGFCLGTCFFLITGMSFLALSLPQFSSGCLWLTSGLNSASAAQRGLLRPIGLGQCATHPLS